TGLTGLNEIDVPGAEGGANKDAIRKALTVPTPDRVLLIAQALRAGLSTADIFSACRFDPWFIERIREIVEAETAVRRDGLPTEAPGGGGLRGLGFGAPRFAELGKTGEAEVGAARRAVGIGPVFKRIDPCAAEFASLTPYMYSTHEGNGLAPAESEDEASAR